MIVTVRGVVVMHAQGTGSSGEVLPDEFRLEKLVVWIFLAFQKPLSDSQVSFSFC